MLYLGPRTGSEFGFHDDGAPNAYSSLKKTMMSLYLLGFVGDFDLDQFDTPALELLLALFIFVTVVVLLNVLIAIVGLGAEIDSDPARSNSAHAGQRLVRRRDRGGDAALLPLAGRAHHRGA